MDRNLSVPRRSARNRVQRVFSDSSQSRSNSRSRQTSPAKHKKGRGRPRKKSIHRIDSGGRHHLVHLETGTSADSEGYKYCTGPDISELTVFPQTAPTSRGECSEDDIFGRLEGRFERETHASVSVSQATLTSATQGPGTVNNAPFDMSDRQLPLTPFTMTSTGTSSKPAGVSTGELVDLNVPALTPGLSVHFDQHLNPTASGSAQAGQERIVPPPSLGGDTSDHQPYIDPSIPGYIAEVYTWLTSEVDNETLEQVDRLEVVEAFIKECSLHRKKVKKVYNLLDEHQGEQVDRHRAQCKDLLTELAAKSNTLNDLSDSYDMSPVADLSQNARQNRDSGDQQNEAHLLSTTPFVTPIEHQLQSSIITISASNPHSANSYTTNSVTLPSLAVGESFAKLNIGSNSVQFGKTSTGNYSQGIDNNPVNIIPRHSVHQQQIAHTSGVPVNMSIHQARVPQPGVTSVPHIPYTVPTSVPPFSDVSLLPSGLPVFSQYESHEHAAYTSGVADSYLQPHSDPHYSTITRQGNPGQHHMGHGHTATGPPPLRMYGVHKTGPAHSMQRQHPSNTRHRPVSTGCGQTSMQNYIHTGTTSNNMFDVNSHVHATMPYNNTVTTGHGPSYTSMHMNLGSNQGGMGMHPSNSAAAGYAPQHMSMHHNPSAGSGHGSTHTSMHHNPSAGSGHAFTHTGMHQNPSAGFGHAPNHTGMHQNPSAGFGHAPNYTGTHQNPSAGGGHAPSYTGMHQNPSAGFGHAPNHMGRQQGHTQTHGSIPSNPLPGQSPRNTFTFGNGGPAFTNPPQATTAPPTRNTIKEMCFQRAARKLLRDFADLQQSLWDLQQLQLETDADFAYQQEEFKVTTGRVRSFLKESEKVGSEGKDLGDITVLQLYNNSDELDAAHRDTEQLIKFNAEQRGIRPKQNIPAPHSLKEPKFTPHKHGTDDYYTFKQKFEDYVKALGCSIEQQFVLLKNLISDQANLTISECPSIQCAWGCLRTAYGNACSILNIKIKEITAVGQCPEEAQQKRDWTQNVNSKLQTLYRLACENNLTNDLFHSSLAADLAQLMVKDSKTKFYEICTRLGDMCGGSLQKEQIFMQLLQYVQHLTLRTTTETNLAYLAPKTSYYKKTLPQQTVKKYHCTTCTAGGSPSPSPPTSPSPSPPPSPSASNNSQTAHANIVTVKATQSKKPGQKAQQSNPNKKIAPPPKEVKCGSCSQRHTHLLYCPDFQNGSAQERTKLCNSLKVCYRCLRLDSEVDLANRGTWLADHKASCVTTFACGEATCAGQPIERQRHITVCRYHFKDNNKKEKPLINSLDPSKVPNGVHFFFTAMHQTSVNTPNQTTVATALTPAAATNPSATPSVATATNAQVHTVISHTAASSNTIPPLSEDNKAAMLMVQLIPATKNRDLLLFFDTGCTGAAISTRASKILGCEVVREGPTELHVTGSTTTQTPYGDDRVNLPLADNQGMAAFNALKMDHVTHKFPLWQLTEAWEELNTGYKKAKKAGHLPKVDKETGGREVDIMLGQRYMKYFPTHIFSLPCGLAIYKSRFTSTAGSRGILAGPHESWMRALQTGGVAGFSFFLTQEARAYKASSNALMFRKDPGYITKEDLAQECGTRPRCIADHCPTHAETNSWSYDTNWDLAAHFNSVVRDEKDYFAIEDLGTVTEYRCVACRNCARCRQGDSLEKVSLKEEAEQAQIENSVNLNVQEKTLEASLPFIDSPATKLTDNKKVAISIFRSQMRNIEKNPDMREDMVKSHDKLVSRGFVMKESDLPSEARKQYNKIEGQGYYIPWRVVFKESSLSTPVRMVFDASSSTPGGDSLNNILAKGDNRLSKILDILVRFRTRRHAFAADVKMAYNGIKLLPQYYKFHRYLWKDQMKEDSELTTWVLLTLIYGVKSAGQQTIAGFLKLADHCESTHPEHVTGADTLRNNTYMDDIMRSEDTAEECRSTAASVAFTLALGSMAVKCFTYSGESPQEDVSADGVHVGMLGYSWAPKEDHVLIDVKDLYFGRPKRGKLPETVTGDFGTALSKKFTRRTVVGKVAGVYDPLGLATPITARFKLDLHELVLLKLGWDDPIDTKYLQKWTAHLHTMQSLRQVTFPRAVIPHNAKSPNMTIIVSCDSSQDIALASVHARFELTDGSFSCQLVTAKSKLVKANSIPRGELKGATMASVLAHTVCRNIKEQTDEVYYVTDSTIVLYWISLDYRPLQATVRNGVIEISRLSSLDQWFHLDTDQNIADHGTRPVTVDTIGEGSEWQNGKPWMSKPTSEFPLRTAADITLDNREKVIALKEVKTPELAAMAFLSVETTSDTASKINARYDFSDYMIDPCKRSYMWALRSTYLVFRALDIMKQKRPKNEAIQYTDEELEIARLYYFRKATAEVKQFSKPSEYKNVTIEKDGVLFYKSRLLDDVQPTSLEKTMRDITPMKFVRPIVDRYSPLAYSIMLHAHTEGIHQGTLVTLQRSREIAFIIGGRSLAYEIRNKCPHCKRFKSRLLNLEMGNIHKDRLVIAPPFYMSQLDIMGPFDIYDTVKKRVTLKVWGLVFKCMTTSAVSVKTMEDYSSIKFTEAFTRHVSQFNFPKKLYIDAGAQLIKGCKDMKFALTDWTKDMNAKHHVSIEHEICPVGSHNYNGLVERSIREVKKLFTTLYRGKKMSALAMETAFNWVCSMLNNLPVCTLPNPRDPDHIDLVTPNRLIFGSNVERAPTGPVTLGNASEVLQAQIAIQQSWYKCWESQVIQSYIPRSSKWPTSDDAPKIGDVVIFMRVETDIVLGERAWRVGIVTEAPNSKDGAVRKVTIKYRNASERVFRTTIRSVRHIAIIHPQDESELVPMLNECQRLSNVAFHKEHPSH